VSLTFQFTCFSCGSQIGGICNKKGSVAWTHKKSTPLGRRTKEAMTEEAQALMCCANCGNEEESEAKLKTCSACKLAKYCGRDCQIAHRPQHKNACNKRAAELHDEALFRQPPKADDCPICFLLLPVVKTGQLFRACCGKIVCSGCCHEHELQSSGLPSCPFCRADLPTAEGYLKMLEKRVDVNDSDAIYNLGMRYFEGDEVLSIKKDIDEAIKLLHRAANLGSADAYYNLGVLYHKGEGVNKDKIKAKQYLEKAAMAGSAKARFALGNFDAQAGSFGRAIKHWLIAASGGYIMAVNEIKKAMSDGNATKDDYAQALRGYTQYHDEIRSDRRDRAAAYSEKYKYLPDM
jgi:TPR repeat protein